MRTFCPMCGREVIVKPCQCTVVQTMEKDLQEYKSMYDDGYITVGEYAMKIASAALTVIEYVKGGK